MALAKLASVGGDSQSWEGGNLVSQVAVPHHMSFSPLPNFCTPLPTPYQNHSDVSFMLA